MHASRDGAMEVNEEEEEAKDAREEFDRSN